MTRKKADPVSTGAGAAAPEPFYTGATHTRGESIGWLMKQVVARLSRELHDRMASLEVTAAQWPVLLLMNQGTDGGPTAIELARQLSMDAGAMTRMIDRMSEKGLIERSRCPQDRRATRLALTDSGREAVGPIAETLAATLNDLLHGFSREEFDTLVAMLRRLDANARSFPSSSAGMVDAPSSSAARGATPDRRRTGAPAAMKSTKATKAKRPSR